MLIKHDEIILNKRDEKQVSVDVYNVVIADIDIGTAIGTDDEYLENSAIKIVFEEKSNCIAYTTAQLPIFNPLTLQRMKNLKAFYGAKFCKDLIGKGIKLVMLDGGLIAFGSPIEEKFFPLWYEKADILTWDELKSWLTSNYIF